MFLCSRVLTCTVMLENDTNDLSIVHKHACNKIPKEAAPRLVEVLVDCGVKGFWNFSHYDILNDYPDVIVENVHMGDSLMTLSYHMVQGED